MDATALAFSLIPLTIGLTCLSLGIFVLLKNDDQRLSQAFMVTMCMVLINCVAQFLLANAPNSRSAESFGRILFLSAILLSVSFLYLTKCLLTLDTKKKAYWWRYYLIAIIAAMAIASAIIAGPFVPGAYGFWPLWSDSLLAWLIMLAVLVAIPLILLMGLTDRSKDRGLERKASIIAMGAVTPFLIICFDMFMVWSNIEIVHLMPLGMLISACIFAVEILSHHEITPSRTMLDEADIGHDMETNIKLAPGPCDLLKSKRVDLSYRMFVAEVAAGNTGLLITRVHPEQIRERYGLVKTPILWLSGQPGPDRLDPASLSIVQHTIIDFLQKTPQSVILLDGLEYLATENQVDKVLRLIYSVHDAVVITGSKFIVPINPQILSPRDLALFEREFVVIEDALLEA